MDEAGPSSKSDAPEDDDPVVREVSYFGTEIRLFRRGVQVRLMTMCSLLGNIEEVLRGISCAIWLIGCFIAFTYELLIENPT